MGDSVRWVVVGLGAAVLHSDLDSVDTVEAFDACRITPDDLAGALRVPPVLRVDLAPNGTRS